MKIDNKRGHLQDWITQLWVKVTGRRIDIQKHDWLLAPVGDVEIIKDQFAYNTASKENLNIIQNAAGSGLFESIDDWELNNEERRRINPFIIDFYEKTLSYTFEVWSEWRGIFKPFGWLLSVIFSKRLEQLNLPLSSMESARGVESNIIKLKDKETNKTKWTIWFRVLKSTKRVIYSGVYTTCYIPNFPEKHFKVVFPLPNGSATVILKREILSDGSLLLTSSGRKFGDNGFYFMLTNHEGKYWAKFVKAMHEKLWVYVDEEGILRADHNLSFYGFALLDLHYKMSKKQ